MDEILRRIKTAVLAGRFEITGKAALEMLLDSLVERDIVESILQAREIAKTLRSKSAYRKSNREYLHIIVSANFAGKVVYTKGTLRSESGLDIYYISISAKHAD